MRTTEKPLSVESSQKQEVQYIVQFDPIKITKITWEKLFPHRHYLDLQMLIDKRAVIPGFPWDKTQAELESSEVKQLNQLIQKNRHLTAVYQHRTDLQTGVHAITTIPKNTQLFCYIGEVKNARLNEDNKLDSYHCAYGMGLDSEKFADLYVDCAAYGNISCLINDAPCKEELEFFYEFLDQKIAQTVATENTSYDCIKNLPCLVLTTTEQIVKRAQILISYGPCYWAASKQNRLLINKVNHQPIAKEAYTVKNYFIIFEEKHKSLQITLSAGQLKNYLNQTKNQPIITMKVDHGFIIKVKSKRIAEILKTSNVYCRVIANNIIDQTHLAFKKVIAEKNILTVAMMQNHMKTIKSLYSYYAERALDQHLIYFSKDQGCFEGDTFLDEINQYLMRFRMFFEEFINESLFSFTFPEMQECLRVYQEYNQWMMQKNCFAEIEQEAIDYWHQQFIQECREDYQEHYPLIPSFKVVQRISFFALPTIVQVPVDFVASSLAPSAF